MNTEHLPPLLGFMARNQYGETLHLPSPHHPRKQLLEKLGRKSCVRQYTDRKDGSAAHTGYVVGGEWWTLYQVREFTS